MEEPAGAERGAERAPVSMGRDSDMIRKWGMSWRAAPSSRRLFEGDGLKGLFAGSPGTVLRSSRTRKVVRWRGACAGGGVNIIAKIYEPSRFPLSLFRSRGMREYRALREAERRGIETVRPLAVGEKRRAGVLVKNCLLTEEMEGCVPLSELRLREMEVRARRRLIRSVARALRRFHDGGVLHRDLHSGNILLSRREAEGGGEPSVFIIDLHGAGFRPALRMRERVMNLVQLDTYYGLTASRADRCSFLLQYARGLGCDLGELAATVEAAAARARLRLWRRRRKRYLRTGKYARRLRQGGYAGCISPRHDTPAMRSLLIDPPGAYGRGSVIKSSRTNRVSSLSMEGSARVVVKWHRPPTFKKRAGSFMRASRGRRAWCSALGLAERMIGAPDAIAYVDRRRFGFITDSFFLAFFLEGGAVLPHYARDMRPGMSVRERREFCRELGKFLAGVHRRGVSHTDLKGSNIMVRGGSGPPRFYLLDPEAVKFSGRLRRETVLENLARLDRYMRSWTSATDRLATLSSYLSARGEYGLMEHFWKRLGRAVEEGGAR